jgi:hypothetical protein
MPGVDSFLFCWLFWLFLCSTGHYSPFRGLRDWIILMLPGLQPQVGTDAAPQWAFKMFVAPEAIIRSTEFPPCP